MNRFSDNLYFNISYERFGEYKILRNLDENVVFIIFNFLRKRSEIETRLNKLNWTFKFSFSVLDMVWTDDIIHHLNLQLLLKYHIFKTL